jgi:NADPH-dependent 2,4-dienoyl-CoA reductase/sulfur reductase-like enzyme
MKATFDVVVVGAGPGGIAASAVAAEAGMRVCLLDNNPASGGQIWRGLTTESASHSPHGRQFAVWTERLAASGCSVRLAVEVVDCPAPGMLLLESADGAHHVAFNRLILATGARERFLPFPGWTLPGVLGAGGLQALVKSGLDPAGRRIVVAGTGPLLLAAAAALAQRGASVQAIVEQAPRAALMRFGLSALAHPAKLLEGAAYRRQTFAAPYRFGWWVARAAGKDRVESIVLTNGREEQSVSCEWIACAYHLVPNLELPRLLGCRIDSGYVSVDSMQQSSVPGIACVGELTGIGGMEKALLEGEIAGLAAAGRYSAAHALTQLRNKWAKFAADLDHAFAPRPGLRALPTAETIVCRCEDVPHGVLASCRNWREAKLHTRCGMGPCQGRICGSAAEFLYGWEAAAVRPPIFPVKVSALVAEASASAAPQP